MQQMVWDEELAKAAQMFAEECVFQRQNQADRIGEQYREDTKVNFVGQILAGRKTSLAMLDVVRVVYSLAGARGSEFNQIVFPLSGRIGCGFNFCRHVQKSEEYRTDSTIIICNYAPGSTGEVKAVSQEGEGCSSCLFEQKCFQEYLCSATGEEATVKEDDNTDPPSSVPSIRSMSVTRGSVNGGTRVDIGGRNLSPDLFSYQDSRKGYRVLFYNNNHQVECSVENYYSSSTQISCVTQAAPAGTYNIRVYIDGVSVEDRGGWYCGSCRFRYRTGNTPYVYYTTSHGCLGDPVVIHGRLWTVEFLKMDEENPDGDVITGIQVDNSLRCVVTDGTTIYSSSIDDSGVGNVTCIPEVGNTIGSFDLTVTHSRYGRSTPITNRIGLSADGFKPYLYQTHAHIDSVSPSSGSTEGGTVITIQGKGFYPNTSNDITVLVGGVECEVLNVSSTEIQCRTGPRSDRLPLYPGGRGLLREIWQGYRSVSSIPSLTPDTSGYNYTVTDEAWAETGYPIPFNASTYISQKFSGFLVPPATGRYTIDVLSDDASRIYLSTDSDPANKRLMAEAYAWSRGRWNYWPAQRSQPVDLEGGRPYYLEMVLNQGRGPWSIYLGLKYHNSTLSRSEVTAEHEVQKIAVDSIIVQEHHTAIIGAVPRVISSVVTCDEWPYCTFRVGFGGAYSEDIPVTTSQNQMERVINSITDLTQFGAILVDAGNTSDSTLSVNLTLLLPPMQAALVSMATINGSHIMSDTSSATGPERITLSLGDNRYSDQMNVANISSLDIRGALLHLSSWQCDDPLKVARDVYWSEDYEGEVVNVGSWYEGVVVSDTEPYCGRHSLFRPRFLFVNSFRGIAMRNIGFDLYTYRYMCFAYNGKVPNNRFIFQVWMKVGDRNVYYNRVVYLTPGGWDDRFMFYTSWEYQCFNLYDSAKDHDEFDVGRDHVVRWVVFDSTSEDFWIDNTVVTADEIVTTNHRNQPSVRPGGVYIRDVTTSVLSWPPQDLFEGDSSAVNRTKLNQYLEWREGGVMFPWKRVNVFYDAHNCGAGITLLSVSGLGGCGQACINESRTAEASPSISGTFTVATSDGRVTRDIPVGASAEEVKQFLEEIHEGVEFDVTAGDEICHRSEWTVEWVNRGGDQDPLIVNTERVGGVGVSGRTEEEVHGGILFRPVRGDMLKQPHHMPQVEVIINNIPSSCHRGDCGFNFTDELTPELFRSHPSTGTSRTVITIIGQGFTLGNVDPTVRIGQANCAVSSFNDTTITCTAGPSQAGTLPISVHVGTVGRALRPMGVALFTYQLTVNSVDRNSGSVGGGTLIRIRGNGFPALPMRGNDSHSEIFGKHLEWIYSSIWPPSDVPTMCVSRFQREIETEIQNGNGTSNESMALNMTRNDTESDRMHPPVLVLVGDFPCLIVTSSLNEIACLTPPSLGGEAVVNISVCIEGELVQLEDGFSYTDNLTPSITNHSPSSTSVLEDVTLTLTGAQLDTTGDPVVVAIHLRTRNHTFCNVTSHSSSEIQCSMNSTALSPGRYRVGVFFPEQAHPSYQVPCSESGDCPHPIYTPLHFTVVLFVDSATPTNGSLLGDARLTISGGGFPTENLTVTIGNRKCELIGINESHITCNTPGLQRTHNGFMTGMFSNPWVPASLTIYTGDSVKWEWTSLFDIHQVVTPTSPRLPGFHRDPVEAGSLVVLFATPGEYMYGGYIDQNTGAELRGVVRVLERRAVMEDIAVWAGPFRAMTANMSTASDEILSFSYHPSSTPVVNRISFDHFNLALSGWGFGSCDSVTLMSHDSDVEYSCNLVYQDDYNISCMVDVSQQPPVGVPLKVLVHTEYGLALVAPVNQSSLIKFTPVVTRIAHPYGSVLGGGELSIMGYGLDSLDRVLLGTSPCVVTHTNYTDVRCTTPPAPMEAGGAVDITMEVHPPRGVRGTAVCDATCVFNYTEEATPVIESLIPTSISSTGSQTVTLSGTFLAGSDDGFSVAISPLRQRTVRSPLDGTTNLTCTLTAITTSTLTCTLPQLCAGRYTLTGQHTTLGYALNTNGTTFVIEPEITMVTPQEGSIAGGTVIEILGGGFSPDPSDITVESQDGEHSCTVTSSAFNKVTCVTPPHPPGEESFFTIVNGAYFPAFQFNYSTNSTPYIHSIRPNNGSYGDEVTLSVSNVPDNASVVVNIGNVRCMVTMVTEDEVRCIVGLNYVGEYRVSMRVDPLGSAHSTVTFIHNLVLSEVSPVEGSLTGLSELVITGIGFDPTRTSVTVCGQRCDISDAVAPPTTTQVRCILPPNTNVSPGSGGSEVCDVAVTSLSAVRTLYGAYSYNDSLTPTIRWVEPRRGGSAGGTSITIFGSGLDGNVSVTIGSVGCTVTVSNSTHITCRTGASRATVTSLVMVFVEGRGFAYPTHPKDATFRYVDLWSSTFTWGGEDPPVEGDFVVVPKGQTLSIDVDTPILSVLLVEGGNVLFDDNQNVSLHAEHILIVNNGSLQVGTEENPFQHHAEIVLYGHPLSTEIPLFGAKTLSVREGTLDLHGRPLAVTWTRLSSTAMPGDTVINLQEAVDWEVGGRIVIASTSRSQRENEEAEIVAIDNTGKILMISRIPDPGETPTNSPLGLKYKHISVQQTLGGAFVDTSAEVGYLTRNVVVRGNRLQEWVRVVEDCTAGFNVGMFATQTCFEGRFGVEETDDQFGSQIMLHAAEQNQGLVVGRIEYIEVTHAGQAFRLGRYPIHFHLNGDVTGSYVRGCGIHRTFNRAVTIHAVNHLLVEKNVAYNIMGHAYFLEDGVEEYNVIQDNLGIFVRASSSLLNVDITPATFWIVNPRNYVRRNAAAGGTHFGFWYRLENHPTGPSATTSVCPRKIPLLEFTNNTAHSFGWYGIWVFPHYYPTAEGTCSGSTPKKAEFTNFLSWRNTRGVEFTEVGSLQLKDSIMVDNELAGVEVIGLSNTCWGEEGPLIDNVIIAGHTPSMDEEVPGEVYCTDAGIKLPSTDYLTVSNITFVNFGRGNCRPIKACAHCKAFQGGFESRFSGLRFESVTHIIEWKWEHEHVCRDLDGSLTGIVGGALLPHSPLLPSDQCKVDTGLSRILPSGVCNPIIRFQRVAIDSLTPPSLEFQYLLISSGDPSTNSSSRVPWRFKRLSKVPGLMAVLPLERYYMLTWENGSHLTNISYRALFNKMSDGDHLWFSHQFPQPLDIVNINGQQREQIEVVPNPTEHGNGDWHYSEATDIVYYLVEGSSSDMCKGGQDNSLTFDSYKCFFLNCIIPEPVTIPPPPKFPNRTLLWSEIWGNTSTLGETNDVTIEPLWHVVVDVPIPRVRHIIVYGVLQLNDTMDHHIQANVIYIRGGKLIAGLPGQPFQHKVTFTLYGEIKTPEISVPLRAPAVGSKAIGVFGQLILNGALPSTPMWTHLTQEVQPGDSSLTVRGSVDWSVGDEIVVTATSYEPLEAESFTINSIRKETTQTVISINGTFRYKHLSDTRLVQGPQGTVSYSIRAEVGLLSRRIRIENGNPDISDSEMFGCRVIVGYLEEDGYSYVGSAQLEGVEFSGCGQYGYTFTRDPRFALAFLHAGDVVNASSYIHRCSFHDGYNVGVGAFGTNQLELVDNIIHNQVGHSIWMDGRGHVLSGNLAGVAHFPGLYRGVDQPENFEWTANYQLVDATDFTLIGNVAAGGQRVGFHVRGEPCNPSNPDYKAWSGNVAHSTLHGVHTLYAEGHPSGCGLYNDFTIYNCYRFGLFAYSTASVMVTNSLFVNNKAGIHANVMGPRALSHLIGNKFVTISNIQIMSRSVDFTCEDDSIVPDVARHPKSFGTGFRGPNGGHVGLVIPAYLSGGGLFPKFAPETIHTYPAINGHTSVDGLTLANFNEHCSGRWDRAVMSNPAADDAIHPVSLQNLRWIETPSRHRLFVQDPPLGHVNPSDCVDMDCDGHKHTLLTDVDGSFTGDGSRRTIIAMAEFEWDGDRRRGIGDYRIPKTMLTNPDGSRINTDSIYPKKGIVRGTSTSSSCAFIDSWNMYTCHSIEHKMIVLESLDADTEVRRLSPIGVGGNGYIDLLNGPQDQGWCGGYTCQERISTFYGVVATGVEYTVGLTSTNPQKFRVLLLNSGPSDVITIGIIYTTPQLLEVMVDGALVIPKHTELVDGELVYKRPEDHPNRPDLFRVNLTDPHGTNFYDRDRKTLYITLTGSSPVEIHTSPLIQISVTLAPITVDEFFGENLRNNLATLLNIDKRRIRIVNVIAEDSVSSRRRRATDGIQVDFEIGNLPTMTAANTTNDTDTDNSGFEELSQVTTTLVNAIQTGDFNEQLNVSVVEADVQQPQPPPVDPTGGVRATPDSGGPQPGNVTNGTLTFSDIQMMQEAETEAQAEPVTFIIPTRLVLYQEPSSVAVVRAVLTQQPKLYMVDAAGVRVPNIGIGTPWRVGVEVIGEANSTAVTGSTAEFTGGWANFSSLSFQAVGRYQLRFSVVYPSSASFETSSNVSVTVTSNTKVQSNLLAVYVGSGVGGALLLIIIVGVIVILMFYLSKFCKSKHKKKLRPDQEQYYAYIDNVYENHQTMSVESSGTSTDEPSYEMMGLKQPGDKVPGEYQSVFETFKDDQ
jgi:plastocyanin